MWHRRSWQVLVVVAALGAAAAGLTAVAHAQGQGPDVLAALLVEVRGLRAAMEQMASAGPRIQLATARLQLQEQRINNLLRRLESTRDAAANRQQELTEQQERLRQLEEAMKERDAPSGAAEVAAMVKQAIASKTTELQRLQFEESQISQDIAVEQARWTDINQRLDELDRALTRK
jgi:phage-related tail protein